MASVSAFCQQRRKLLPGAMDFLFHSFNNSFCHSILTVDFACLPAMAPVNALCDLKNRIYVDAVIQSGRSPNEAKAVIQQKDRKYTYQINFTVAVFICREYFRNRIPPPDLEVFIRKNILPVREGRKAPRKVSPNSATSFLYRIT